MTESRNIAIVGPSPVPFVMGGVENLLSGLQHHINQLTPHHCELLKLPSREHDFWSLLETYESFFRLDVSHFDMVITTKYPAWMVRHPNHVCYVQHRLRGLYDTYSFCGEPVEFRSEIPAVRRVLDLIEDRNLRGSEGIERVFDALRRLRDVASSVPPDVFKFPGPFIRKILHFLDDRALADGGARRFLAIARTVANRREYFPEGAQVTVLHHPSFLVQRPGNRAGGKPYFFTASRLDGPKRIGLIVEAMKQVPHDVDLKISGTGPLDLELRRAAAGDPRIALLGYTPDDRLADLYAGALAVIFVPYQEDYGLITIEAMRAGKPVLTVVDAGGPNEFVTDGETGFSVAPDPAALAEKMTWLAANPGAAERMGETARDRVSGITWERTVRVLLGEELARVENGGPRTGRRDVFRDAPSRDAHSGLAPAGAEDPGTGSALARGAGMTPDVEPGYATEPDGARSAGKAGARVSREPRGKIVLTSTFPIYPPRGGGQNRIYYLYRALARNFDVEIVSVIPHGEPAFRGEIAPGLIETRVPKSQRHQQEEWALEREAGTPVTDVAMPRLVSLSPDYAAALGTALRGADWVVASHPYLLPAIAAQRGEIPLVFEAHNVEVDLKAPVLGQTTAGRALLNLTREVELEACRQAELVMTCSQADARRLDQLCPGTATKALVVPNGVDLASVPFVPWAERQRLRREAGLLGERIAIFVGAWHPPNLEAAERILEFAAALPAVTFLIVGSVAAAFEGRSLPRNVHFTGVVDDDLKAYLLGLADVALNPMTTGSGTNLKMLDYFSAGVPVLSTPFGARGLEVEEGTHVILAEPELMAERLESWDSKAAGEMAARARTLAETRYCWDVIAAPLCERLQARQTNSAVSV